MLVYNSGEPNQLIMRGLLNTSGKLLTAISLHRHIAADFTLMLHLLDLIN
jgi:hypothetical protein